MADEKKAPKLDRRNFAVAGHFHNRWQLDLPEHIEIDAVFDPAAWVHLVDVIWGHNKAGGRGDIIEIRKIDVGLYAEIMVQEIGPGFVKVSPIRAYEPKEVKIAEEVPFKVQWNPGKQRHEVRRKADNQVMAGDFQSRESAAAWIDNHMKAMQKAA